MVRLAGRSRQAEIRHPPRYELLESRIALAIDGGPGDTPPLTPTDGISVDVGPQTEQAPLSVELIDPAPDSMLTASPLSILLEFNRPILPDTVNQDVVVVRIDPDGNPTGSRGPL